MCGEIVFYTHGSTIEYGGEIFPPGELTADILNFAPEAEWTEFTFTIKVNKYQLIV